MTDISDAVPFVAVAPCRVADTRAPAGFAGQAGGPALAPNATRTFQIAGVVPGLTTQCGIPPAAAPGPSVNDGGTQAVSFMFTIIQPNSAGNLIAWPVGAVPFNTSVLNYEGGIFSIGNGITVAINTTTGAVNVYLNASASAHLTIDVNGYYGTASLASAGYFFWARDSTHVYGAGRFENTNASTSVTYGMTAAASSTGHGTAAVLGQTLGTTGHTFGGKFTTASNFSDAAGVKGVNGYGDPLGDTGDCLNGCWTAGVRGVGNDAIGVLGISRNTGGFGGGVGVSGVLLTSPTGDTEVALGYLGVSFGTDPDPGTDFPWAVFGAGDIGATGTKHFVEPHPTDPSLVIKYTSLEGPEAGTYFRGKGKFVGGLATIEVPEDFRLVTAAEGLTIQVTPIGQMATVAVQRIGLDRIVVQGSRNVEFFYLVHGVRRTFRDLKPIQRGGEFMPRKAGAKMPAYLSDDQKRLLIQNGTYREDGGVNMETAHRLGWDRIWAERARPRPEPAPE
jgi:hypothetical protein